MQYAVAMISAAAIISVSDTTGATPEPSSITDDMSFTHLSVLPAGSASRSISRSGACISEKVGLAGLLLHAKFRGSEDGGAGTILAGEVGSEAYGPLASCAKACR